MTATIKDVARLENVSQSTVSWFLTGRNMLEKTPQKVLQTMKELNYHPRRSAKGLAMRRSGNIGFILTDDHFSRSERLQIRESTGLGPNKN